MTKQSIISALRAFIAQRPGLEWGNYASSDRAASVCAYQQEARSIRRDLHDARALLTAVEAIEGIDAAALVDASQMAYSGRLTLVSDASGDAAVDYCTGQYWPVEYRRAVAAVCAQALRVHGPVGGMFSRSIAKRWFA